MGIVSGGQMKPAQMAAMMKQMPAPGKDEKKGDPKETAIIAFSDRQVEGRDSFHGRLYKHPTLGEVEIGGCAPFADNTPPAVDGGFTS